VTGFGEQLRIRRITAYCMLAVCVMTVVSIAADVASPLRTMVILLFVGTVPGWSLISYLNVRHLSVTWISAVGLSISVGVLLAQVLVLTRFWHPEAAVVVLGCACVPVLAHHVVRARPPARSSSATAPAQDGTPDRNEPGAP
jgi:uncharacterized membrane protein